MWCLVLEHRGRCLDEGGGLGVDSGMEVCDFDIAFEAVVFIPF